MISTEERKELIEYIFRGMQESISLRKLQNKVHEVLLKDTVDGKLYKYRTFDENGYSLKNLLEGTLHCPMPTVFNDPFDGTVGISLSLLCEEEFKGEFQKIDAIINTFYNVIDKNVNIEQCSKEEQSILYKLLNSSLIMETISKLRSINQKHNEDCSTIEIKNVLNEFFNIVFNDDLFVPKLGKYKDEVMNLLNMLSHERIDLLMRKEKFTISDLAGALNIKDDADEAELTINIGKEIYPDKQNDISELEKAIKNATKTLSNFIKGLYYIGSLSTHYKNQLMWSHYADSHKGFCIEYDFSTVKIEALLLPVYYSCKRPLLSMQIVSKGIDECFPEFYRQVMLGILTKDKIWEYENEWRILLPAALGEDFVEYKMPKISCIYLGEAISEKNREKILKIAKRLSLPVKQMKMDIGTYDLHAEDIIV